MHLKCVVFYLQICSLLFSFYVNLDKINIIQNSPLYFKAHNPVAFHTHTILYNHCVCMLSGVQLFVTPWTVAHHAPLSMGFSRQGYWSELPFPPPRDLPNTGIKLLCLLHWQADPLPLSHLGSCYTIITAI